MRAQGWPRPRADAVNNKRRIRDNIGYWLNLLNGKYKTHKTTPWAGLRWVDSFPSVVCMVDSFSLVAKANWAGSAQYWGDAVYLDVWEEIYLVIIDYLRLYLSQCVRSGRIWDAALKCYIIFLDISGLRCACDFRWGAQILGKIWACALTHFTKLVFTFWFLFIQ